jgi:hypothetical protein
MIVHPLDPSTDPNDEIRTDLWNTMTMTQLYRQQELMIERLNQLHTMSNSLNSNSLAILQIYNATRSAFDQLNALVEHKTGGSVNA